MSRVGCGADENDADSDICVSDDVDNDTDDEEKNEEKEELDSAFLEQTVPTSSSPASNLFNKLELARSPIAHSFSGTIFPGSISNICQMSVPICQGNHRRAIFTPGELPFAGGKPSKEYLFSEFLGSFGTFEELQQHHHKEHSQSHSLHFQMLTILQSSMSDASFAFKWQMMHDNQAQSQSITFDDWKKNGSASALAAFDDFYEAYYLFGAYPRNKIVCQALGRPAFPRFGTYRHVCCSSVSLPGSDMCEACESLSHDPFFQQFTRRSLYSFRSFLAKNPIAKHDHPLLLERFAELAIELKLTQSPDDERQPQASSISFSVPSRKRCCSQVNLGNRESLPDTLRKKMSKDIDGKTNAC